VLAAIEAGKTIALANKEILVMAGGLVTAAARRAGVTILPVDSEHNAIHQCLHGRSPGEVKRLILTASGGPFRGHSATDLQRVTADVALQHPTWRMGRKITIDSATLMNKGLEVIEAHWLFGMPYDRIRVLIHPQSVVHGIVEFVDGSLLAQLAAPDMRGPIHHALAYPERVPAPWPRPRLCEIGGLSFEEPDRQAFPMLDLGYAAGRRGGTAPAVYSAANEAAVELFLRGAIRFPDIPRSVESALGHCASEGTPDLDAILAAEARAREHVNAMWRTASC
jgi:1-deoxy-D-xylulose-5-phosphate reductoisomerase